MLASSAAFAVMWCLSVCLCVCVSVMFVNCVKTNKHIFNIFSPSGSKVILVFPYQTGWQYSSRNPSNGDVACRWGRQKSRFWANSWLHGMLWVWSAIYLAATDQWVDDICLWWVTEFVFDGRRRRSVWQEASMLRRGQRYAVINLKPKWQ